MVTKFGECKKERLCNCLVFDNLQSLICARDGNRTRTDISVHRILSPACIPISPPEQTVCKDIKSS